ncbi:AraC family transcriptional regulator [Algoriphagus namhaensis]
MPKAPLLQKLPPSPGSSFLAHRFESPWFETPWHYHEEIELLLCDGGWGKKYVGNHLSEYQQGDVFLLGSNLPHWFAADESIYKEDLLKPAAIVIQFTLESFGADFFELEEMNRIRNLLREAAHGLEFLGKSRENFGLQIKELLQSQGSERLILLLDLLGQMTKSAEVKKLTPNPVQGLSVTDSPRMHTILEYLLANYDQEIKLETVADLVNMSPAGFCRYLKSRTQKTLIELVNEFRINQACKLLRESELKIVEISLEVGFSNLSNFNRQFKRYTGVNPQAYRQSRNI